MVHECARTFAIEIEDSAVWPCGRPSTRPSETRRHPSPRMAGATDRLLCGVKSAGREITSLLRGKVGRWRGAGGKTAMLREEFLFGRLDFGIVHGARSKHGAFEGPSSFQIRLDHDHPWRPPFGLKRIGRPIHVIVETRSRPEPADYQVVVRHQGKEVARYPVQWPETPPYSAAISIEDRFLVDEMILTVDQAKKSPESKQPIELARCHSAPGHRSRGRRSRRSGCQPRRSGDRPCTFRMVTHRTGPVRRARFCCYQPGTRRRRCPSEAWFESAPAKGVNVPLILTTGRKAEGQLKLPAAPTAGDRDTLSVTLKDDAERVWWRKSIPVMLVREPPRRPAFGTTYEQLRYDAPISVCEPATGMYSSLSYDHAWDPELRDVVVWLPNGGRFVFWRGASYIPFWAGRHNTASCYEWAEIISRPEGAVDCVEPLMDKTLKYGRVAIVESTAARVHVRWSYQSTDFQYKVWGDAAIEDYYFYPDGFGTRVVNLKSDPKNDYELSEFIILTPQGAYPLDVLPDDPVDALFLDGRKHRFQFPNPSGNAVESRQAGPGAVPAIYRLRMNKKEELSAVYFNPIEVKLPPLSLALFSIVANWSRRATGAATGRWRGEIPRVSRSMDASNSLPVTTVS